MGTDITKFSIAIFASGKGTNLVAIKEACDRGEIPGQVKLVITDRRCDAAAYASKNSIPCYILPLNNYVVREDWDKSIIRILDYHNIDLVCLAGFMRILGKEVLKNFNYGFRVLNIHPGILPVLAGKDPQKRAIENKFKITGNTVHIVTDIVDDATYTLSTDSLEILESDTVETLCDKLKEKGYETYIKGINKWIKEYGVKKSNG